MLQGGDDVVVVGVVHALPFGDLAKSVGVVHVPEYFNETAIFRYCERLLVSPVQVLLGNVPDVGVPSWRTTGRRVACRSRGAVVPFNKAGGATGGVNSDDVGA